MHQRRPAEGNFSKYVLTPNSIGIYRPSRLSNDLSIEWFVYRLDHLSTALSLECFICRLLHLSTTLFFDCFIYRLLYLWTAIDEALKTVSIPVRILIDLLSSRPPARIDNTNSLIKPPRPRFFSQALHFCRIKQTAPPKNICPLPT